MENSFSNELSVLSLNCWGLYIVAKKREFRLHSIADRLSEEDYDIVALQEVWVLEDFDYIKETVSHKLPYSKYFYSGTMGSGLAILSRYPILSSSYLKFTLAGRPLKIFQGDFYVGKGCGCVCIDHPDIGLLDVYTTHLQAEYGDVIEYEAQRITECWQIANSVRTSAAQGRHVILAGDFNSVPASCCYKILTEHGFMVDTWLEVKKDGLEDDFRLLHSNDLAPSECIQRFGITCDSPVNTWSKHFLKQHPYNHNIGDRLDYIYYRRTPHMTCLQSRVVMVDLIPNTAMSYSDHFGVHSIFNIKSDTASSSIDNNTFQPIIRPDHTSLSHSSLESIITIINKDINKVQNTSNKLLYILGITVLMVIVTYIILVVVPVFYHEDRLAMVLLNFVGGILIIGSSISATVCLIVGFVFGWMEERSMRQYVSDITNCQLNIQRNEIKQKNTIKQSSFTTSSTSTSSSHQLMI